MFWYSIILYIPEFEVWQPKVVDISQTAHHSNHQHKINPPACKQHVHCVFKEIERWLQSNVAPCKFLINDIHLYIISFPKTFIKSCTLHCHADINACMSKNWTACDMYSDNKSQSASFIAEFWHILQKFWGVYDRILTSYLLQRDG